MSVKSQLIPIAMAWSLVLSGCYSTTTTDSKHIDRSQIYQTYSVSENGNSGLAQCEAIFTITERSGNKVILTGKAGIKVNGEKMTSSDQFGRGTIYSRTIDGGTKNFTFNYKDAKGKKLTNKLKVNRKAIFNFPDTIRLTDTLKLPMYWNDLNLNTANMFFMDLDSM